MSEQVTVKEYVDHLFNHPVSKNEWYWEGDAPYLEIEPSHTAKLIAEIFENSNTHLDIFTDEQVNQGLWYLLSNSCSNYMIDAIADESVDDLLKMRLLRSVLQLFKTTIAVRCTPHLSNIDEQGASPLNSICYMWWGLMDYWVSSDKAGRRTYDIEALSIMRQILDIPHDACRESALHGLGHRQADYPDEVALIIDQWLESAQDARERLRAYAQNARSGMVL